MAMTRLILPSLLCLGLLACNKSQPSGVPETSSAPPPPPAAAAAPPAIAPTTQPTAQLDSPTPALDEPIVPYEKTGYPDCDDYVEAYRQCLNTRLGPDERESKTKDLDQSMRVIRGNIARGVDAARVAGLCKKAQRLASNKLANLGCTL